MDTLFLALRVVVSLAAVLGVIWFIQKRAGRGSLLRAKARPITVVGRQNVGAKASVAVVEFGGKRFFLGVTEHSINVLDSAEIEETVTVTAVEPAPAVVAENPVPILPAAPVASRRAASKSIIAKTAATTDVAAADAATATGSSADVFASALTEAEANRPAEVAAQAAPPVSPVAGSILSAATWKQAYAALRTGR